MELIYLIPGVLLGLLLGLLHLAFGFPAWLVHVSVFGTGVALGVGGLIALFCYATYRG